MIKPEDDQEKLRDFIIQEFSTGSKNAIEAATFLYFNKERAYPDRDIYKNVKENIKTNGITPERTFSTEIRKYTNNSPQKLTVSHKKLFTIIDLEERPQRFQLIKDVRSIIDNHFNSLKSEEIFWKCPKSSCNFNAIKISRNNENIIDSKTYTNIIIHFLQHLSQKNPLFGSTDIIKIFLDHTPKGILSVEDRGEYIYDGRTSDKIWKNQIRSALNSLRSKGYVDTEDSLDIIEKFNENIKDRRKLRKRKRTDLFKTDFDLYDDWEILQSNEIIKKEKNYWIFQSNPKLYNLERAVNEIYEDLFRVTRYKDQIKKGDKVIFWVSGESAGIVGYGDVLNDPKIFNNLEEFQDSARFIVDDDYKKESENKDILRVKVTYNPIKKIFKDDVLKIFEKNNVDFSEISIFKYSQGRIFL
ncbi:MAG: EVE domain-containing protein [Candidatus Thorarchaeota archaeon]